MDERAREQSAEDARLVRAALEGDLTAFDTLVSRYQRRAVGLAYRLLSHREDAMEVVQDALLKAYDKLDSLSRPERFGPWLLRIVSNLALNRRRYRALRVTSSLDAPVHGDEDRGEFATPDTHGATPAQIASAGELQDQIAEALETLPETQRQALVLFSMHKMPQKEVAKLLDLSVEAVKWHVFTARKKLKERLKDYL
jgi:RNA polymerase sigma-70 factor (ECF subfamily)